MTQKTKKPLYKYRKDGHVFTVTEYIFGEEVSYWDAYNDYPDESNFRAYINVRSKNIINSVSGVRFTETVARQKRWMIQMDAKFDPEVNEFGEVSP